MSGELLPPPDSTVAPRTVVKPDRPDVENVSTPEVLFASWMQDGMLPDDVRAYVAAAYRAERRRRWVTVGVDLLRAVWCYEQTALSPGFQADTVCSMRLLAALRFERAWRLGIGTCDGPAAMHWLLLADILRQAKSWERARRAACRGIVGGAERQYRTELAFQLSLIAFGDSRPLCAGDALAWAKERPSAHQEILDHALASGLRMRRVSIAVVRRRLGQLSSLSLARQRRALLALGQHARPSMLPEIAEFERTARSGWMVKLLATMQGVEPTLLEWLKDRASRRKGIAIAVLAELQCKAAGPELIEIGFSGSYTRSQQESALRALCRIGDPGLLGQLDAMWSSLDGVQRQCAYRFAASLPLEFGGELLTRGLLDEEPKARAIALQGFWGQLSRLNSVPTSSRPRLLLALHEALELEGTDLYGVIAVLDELTGIAGLVELLNHRNPLVRAKVCTRLAGSLRGLRWREAFEVLVWASADTDPSVRYSALLSLDGGARARHVDLYIKALWDEDERVREVAIDGLCRRTEPGFLERLLELLKTSTTSTKPIVSALLWIPGTREHVMATLLDADVMRACAAVIAVSEVWELRNEKHSFPSAEAVTTLLDLAETRADEVGCLARRRVLSIQDRVQLPQHIRDRVNVVRYAQAVSSHEQRFQH